MTTAVEGPTESAGAAGGSRLALFTTIDQILSSASNALLIFALAHMTSAAQFGIVAILVAIASTWIGFNRGALGTPLLLTAHLERRQVTAEAGYAVSWSLRTGVLAAVVFVAAGAAFEHVSVGFAFALCVPIVLAQDVLRFAAMASGRPAVAMASDGVWAIWMGIVFLMSILHPGVSAQTAVYLWGAGGLVSAIILAAALRVVPLGSRLVEWWRTYLRARLRFGSVYALNQVGAVLVAVAATLLVGSVAAAGLRGAATLFGPIAMFVSALPMVFVPHARRTRGTDEDRWLLLVKTSMVTSSITLIVAAGLVFIPGDLGAVALGASWDEAVVLIPYIGVECAAMCWIVSVYTFLQAQGASRTIFRLNLLQVGLQLTFCLGAGWLVGTAAGIGVALALSGGLSTLVGLRTVRRRIRASQDVAAATTTEFARTEVLAR